MRITDHGSIRLLEFDREAQLNAIDYAAATSMVESLAAASTDDTVAAVVLTGRGRAFCAGVDLAYLESMAANEADSQPMLAFTDSIRRFEKPLIAAVNGPAVGIGATLCLHVDLVLAGRSARFRAPFAAIGVAPEAGSSWLLPQQVGFQFASWMLLSASWIEADEAMRRGLVFDVVPDEQLMSATLGAAGTIAANDPAALRAAKRVLRAGQIAPTDAAMALENAAFRELLALRSAEDGR